MDLKTKILSAVNKAAADAALVFFKPFVQSKTIRESLYVLKKGDLDFRIRTDYYWAAVYITGRRRVKATNSVNLVYFRNKFDDPRLTNGKYPKLKSDVRRLTRQQYIAGLRQNERNRKAGLPASMIVVRYSPMKAGQAVKHYPFFTDNEGKLGVNIQGKVNSAMDASLSGVLREKKLLNIRI